MITFRPLLWLLSLVIVSQLLNALLP